MEGGDSPAPSLRRALLVMTATSFLVPAGGLLTAPILARALSTGGRGELAAAMAPATLMVSIAALGLPDALTYLIARRPALMRRALGVASLLTLAAGAIVIVAIRLALPFLSAGVSGLADLILLGAAITLPSLLISLLRGSAIGANRWSLVTGERIATTSIRVLFLGGLWLAGDLDVVRAVVVTAASPVMAGFVYLRLLRPPSETAEPDAQSGPLAASLLSYGSRVWLGSIAEILLARVSQLLMVPLAGATELGLFVVAITISDITFILAQAIQSALFGVSSSTSNADQVTLTSRLALLVTAAGAAVLAVTLPFWIGPLFGPEFQAATGPTILLLISSVVSVPSMISSAGVSAWGRPGIRSAGLVGTFAVFVGLFVALVPEFGAWGAGAASIVANLGMSAFMAISASRVMHVPASAFLVPRTQDFARLAKEARLGYRKLLGRK